MPSAGDTNSFVIIDSQASGVHLQVKTIGCAGMCVCVHVCMCVCVCVRVCMRVSVYMDL